MSGDDQATHQLLGELKADMATSQRQRTTIFEKLDSISSTLTTLCADHKAHVVSASQVRADLEEVDKRVTGLEKLKARIIGYGAGVAIAGGALGDRITKLFGA